MLVNKDFEKLANSFYGCNGGNLNAPLWFSGIEWGGGVTASELKHEVLNYDTKVVPSDDDLKARLEYSKFQFDQKILKITAIANGKNISEYKNQLKDPNGPFSSNGPIFKLNLYPIAFKDTDTNRWSKDFYDVTGVPTKEQYISWIQQTRFLMFNDLIRKHSPKVIVCCGINSRKDYLLAFSGVDGLFAEPEKTYAIEGKRPVIEYRSYIQPNTKILITPFFGGSNGINKDSECELIGKIVKDYDNFMKL